MHESHVFPPIKCFAKRKIRMTVFSEAVENSTEAFLFGLAHFLLLSSVLLQMATENVL